MRRKVYLVLCLSIVIFFAGCLSQNIDEVNRLKKRNVELMVELTQLQFVLEDFEKKIERYEDFIDTAESNKPKTNILMSDDESYWSALVLPAEQFLPFGAVEMVGYAKTIMEEDAEDGTYHQRTVFVVEDSDPLLLELYQKRIEAGNTINILVDEKVALYFTPPDHSGDLETLYSSNANQMVRIFTYLYRYDIEMSYSRVPDSMKIIAVRELSLFPTE